MISLFSESHINEIQNMYSFHNIQNSPQLCRNYLLLLERGYIICYLSDCDLIYVVDKSERYHDYLNHNI